MDDKVAKLPAWLAVLGTTLFACILVGGGAAYYAYRLDVATWMANLKSKSQYPASADALSRLQSTTPSGLTAKNIALLQAEIKSGNYDSIFSSIEKVRLGDADIRFKDLNFQVMAPILEYQFNADAGELDFKKLSPRRAIYPMRSDEKTMLMLLTETAASGSLRIAGVMSVLEKGDYAEGMTELIRISRESLAGPEFADPIFLSISDIHIGEFRAIVLRSKIDSSVLLHFYGASFSPWPSELKAKAFYRPEEATAIIRRLSNAAQKSELNRGKIHLE